MQRWKKWLLKCCLVPLYLNDPLISFLLPKPSGGLSSAIWPWMHEKFTARGLSSWSAVQTALLDAFPVLLSLAWAAPQKDWLPDFQIPFVEKLHPPQSLPNSSPPFHLGLDIRNWLRKYSNGYQIFGNCFSFSELNICLAKVQAISAINTWPSESLGSCWFCRLASPASFSSPPHEKTFTR